MIRVLIYFAVVVLVALGVVWMADHPGTVLITFGGREIATSTLVGAIVLLVGAAVVAVVWSLLLLIFRVPSLMSGASRSRRRERGMTALSRGLVAIGTGDRAAALRHSAEADRCLRREPMVLLLKAQTAQMAGDPAGAEKSFAEMLNHPETRALGLRGLHIEAQRRNDPEAAYAYAEEALKTATLPVGRRGRPGTPGRTRRLGPGRWRRWSATPVAASSIELRRTASGPCSTPRSRPRSPSDPPTRPSTSCAAP